MSTSQSEIEKWVRGNLPISTNYIDEQKERQGLQPLTLKPFPTGTRRKGSAYFFIPA